MLTLTRWTLKNVRFRSVRNVYLRIFNTGGGRRGAVNTWPSIPSTNLQNVMRYHLRRRHSNGSAQSKNVFDDRINVIWIRLYVLRAWKPGCFTGVETKMCLCWLLLIQLNACDGSTDHANVRFLYNVYELPVYISDGEIVAVSQLV